MSCTNCGNLGSNCSCSDNCPTKTSDITVFDGSFNIIEVPCDASLNDVLTLLESYTTNMVAELSTMTSVVIAEGNCIGLAAGTYSVQQVISAIIENACQCQLHAEISSDPINPKIITVTASGGSAPYTYSWEFKDNIASGSGVIFGGATNTDSVNITGTSGITVLPTCTVTDANGCEYSATFLFLVPA